MRVVMIRYRDTLGLRCDRVVGLLDAPGRLACPLSRLGRIWAKRSGMLSAVATRALATGSFCPGNLLGVTLCLLDRGVLGFT